MARGEIRYFLNEADKALLDEIIAWYLRQVPEGRRVRLNRADEGVGGAVVRDVHIVYTPEGGIPALTRAGTTGTGTAAAQDDTPGSATCRAYRLINGLPRATGVTILVYNFSDVAIPAGKWVKAAREKWGSWIADTVWLEFTECE